MASFTILEPMSTGDVIDRAVRLYRRNFAPIISIVAVPCLIGFVVSVMFWNGYASLLTSASSARGVSVSAIWMLVIGGIGYPVWGFALLVTVSGLSRVVGDYLMLDEPISFRAWAAAARRRLGGITLLAFLLVALLLTAYIVLSIVLFILILGVGLVIGAMAAAGLPQWISTVSMILIVLAAVALSVFLICFVAARLVFLPQIVMIEGESAGSALGRAVRLGRGNWYRFGAIVLFTYFVQFSILSALTLPVLAALYMAGVLNAEFFVSPTWSILYTSFGQISNLLTLPIAIVSFTLLYFDSRVRKEAYDVDLLAREINPGFYWQPPVQASVLGYQMPPQFRTGRTYVQTSPLGLAGYVPVRAPAGSEAPDRADDGSSPGKLEGESKKLSEQTADEIAITPDVAVDSQTNCKSCGAPLVTGARFCMNCGGAA